MKVLSNNQNISTTLYRYLIGLIVISCALGGAGLNAFLKSSFDNWAARDHEVDSTLLAHNLAVGAYNTPQSAAEHFKETSFAHPDLAGLEIRDVRNAVLYSRLAEGLEGRGNIVIERHVRDGKGNDLSLKMTWSNESAEALRLDVTVKLLVAAIILALLVAAALRVLIDRRFLRRIKRLEAQARDITDPKARGIYKWDGSDEIARVGQMLDDAAQVISNTYDQLQGRNQELALANESLEAKVAQRTAEVRQSEEQLRTIVDAFPGYVAWVDRDLVYLGVNRRLASMHNKPTHFFVGKPLGVLGDGGRDEIRSLAEEMLSSNQMVAVREVSISTPVERTFLLTASKFQDGNALVLASIDVTEKNKLQQELEKERAQLIAASKMSVLGEMAGGIAHEINNPLAVIQGNANLISVFAERGPVPQDKAKHFAATIEKTVERIARIVRGLKSYARDSSQDPFVETNVSKLIGEILDLCSERMKNHKIKFTIEPIPPDLTFECRPSQIEQVLMNLLNNAHDAIEDKVEKWISLSVTIAGKLIQVCVMDCGEGIPRAVQERIFNPFFTTKELGKGTGLGLSIAKGIAESHFGRLYVDNTCPNTCFVVEMPKKQSVSVKRVA